MASPHLDTLRDQLERAAADIQPDPALTCKAMFGGIMAYTHERPFASLSDVGLALKLAPSDQDKLLQVTGAQRLQYAPDQPVSKQYIVVPSALRDDPAALRPWLQRSIAYVATLPVRKRTSKRTAPGNP